MEKGTVSGVKGSDVIASGAVIPTGESVTLTAAPNTGYDFDGWYNGDNKVSSNAAYTFNVNETQSLTAKFTAKSYAVTDTLTNASSNGAATATHGTAYSATLTAEAGYELPATITVRINGVVVEAGASTYSYVQGTGVVSIIGTAVTGAIEIIATAIISE